MGIKYFFKWFKDSFPKTVTKPFGEGQKFTDVIHRGENGVNNPLLLLLDLNGIIHTSCQKIYKYGTYEPKSLLKKSPPVCSGEKDHLVFEDVLNSISSLVSTLNPQELVLCIDGVAPISKQIQQRQRRFLSKKTNGGFDSNCISPGTDFLYRLGLYLKAQLEIKLEKDWLNTNTIYFMDSLVPGEGEHKLFDFLRLNQARIVETNFNVVVVGNDADLIMLSLLVSTLFLKKNNIFILREDLISKKLDYLMVNINQFKKNILDFSINKPNFKQSDFDLVVCDFVILCFMVGNDFLPSLPLFNIYDGGLDIIMKYYFTSKGYLTYKSCSSPKAFLSVDPCSNKTSSLPASSKIKLNFKNFLHIFDHILNHVNPEAIQHYKTREYGFPNKLLDVVLTKEFSFVDTTIHYLKSYSLQHNITKQLARAYLEEIDWIFNYYTYGSETIDWKLYYPSQFAPTSLDLIRYIQTTTFNNSTKSNVAKHHSKKHKFKIDPFFQLLCILPPHSADLLPLPLNTVLQKDMAYFHPKEIHIDYEGKLNEWEGIPILPPLDYDKILSLYNESVNLCSTKDLIKNKASKQLMMSIVN
jgi:5'-3' exonuclease